MMPRSFMLSTPGVSVVLYVVFALDRENSVFCAVEGLSPGFASGV